MTRWRAIKLLIQIAVSVLLIGLLVWRIEFRDHITLTDGEEVVGRIYAPTKTERVTPETEVVIVDRRGRQRTFRVADLRDSRDIRFGFISSVRSMDMAWAGLGFALMGLLPLTTGYRWQLLLRVQDVRLGLWTCLKLTVLGFFFDNVMPGSTGGDVIKAYYVARQSHRKAEAAVSVFVDRFVGLCALAVLSGVAVVFGLGRPEFVQVAWVVLAFLGAVSVAGIVFFSRRIRRLVRLDAILAKLPFQRIVQRCDQAVFLYRYHKTAILWALGLSVLTQVTAVISMYLIGRGLGVRGAAGPLGLQSYFVYFPVLMMVSAIPVAPGGLGWREWAFAIFFGFAGVPAGMACALAVMYRVTRMVWSLPGALFLWGGRRVSTVEMARELAEPAGPSADPSGDS